MRKMDIIRTSDYEMEAGRRRSRRRKGGGRRRKRDQEEGEREYKTHPEVDQVLSVSASVLIDGIERKGCSEDIPLTLNRETR